MSTAPIQCPASRKRAVWTITTTAAGPISGGAFTITVSKAGVPYTTNNIAYNAGTMSGMCLMAGVLFVVLSQTGMLFWTTMHG